MTSDISKAIGIVLIALVGTSLAVDTPWILGDEKSVACYTIAKDDIPRPVGLDLFWITSPPTPLDSTKDYNVSYQLRLAPSFWTHPSNVALLGADYSRYYRLCLNETNGCDATGDCCVSHANIHSCRAGQFTCEPWITPLNGTAGSSNATYTLVTHTAAQVGGTNPFYANLRLDAGDWVIISHMRLMTFQCAIGATRASVAPPPVVVKDNTSTVVLAVVLPLVAVGAAAVIVVIVVLRMSKDTRDISDAPTEAPVTLIFTDVQDSTNLWSKFTESMAVSLDIHHALIRSCIQKHKGYEVKTVGDSFMIAVKNTGDALRLCADIQRGLMSEKWPHCITRHYEGEELEDRPEQLEAAETGAQHHGLRVRIGVHVGDPDCVFDEVSKGYDYYGNAVNLAARVEAAACGGQILLSTATDKWLQENPVAGLKTVLQGTILPKGLTEVQEVFTLVAEGVPHREYSRLAYIAAEEGVMGAEGGDTSASETRSHHSLASASMSMAGGGRAFEAAAQKLFESMGPTTGLSHDDICEALQDRIDHMVVLMKPLNQKKQQQFLDLLCEGWRVTSNNKKEGKIERLSALYTRAMLAESNRLRQRYNPHLSEAHNDSQSMSLHYSGMVKSGTLKASTKATSPTAPPHPDHRSGFD